MRRQERTLDKKAREAADSIERRIESDSSMRSDTFKYPFISEETRNTCALKDYSPDPNSDVSRFVDWRKGLKNLGLSKWIKHKALLVVYLHCLPGLGGVVSSFRVYFLRSEMLIDRKCTRCFSFCFIFRVLWFHFLTDFKSQEGGGGRFDPAKRFPFFFILSWSESIEREGSVME